MARACTVCIHPDREAIDKALVTGESARKIAALFRDTSEDALTRHRAAHLPAVLIKAHEAADVAHAIDVVAQLKAINQASIAVLAEARLAGDGDLALKAIDRVQRQIELQAKLLGDLDDRPQVNLLIAPEWLQIRAALAQALAPYPEARSAVAARLSALDGIHARAS